MKKSLVVFFVLILVAFSALAQDNKLAFFAIDSDLTTAGFQGGSVVEGIGGGKRVGFAVYVKNVDQLRTVSVDFTWDSTKAAYASDSGFSIELDDRNVNGVAVTLSEANALGSPASVGEVNVAGHYAITFAKLGGDAVVSTDYVLAFLFVIKTDTAFTSGDSFSITAKISVFNDGGVEKKLGERNFYVNEHDETKYLELTAPNGGEIWTWSWGMANIITWNSISVENIKIEYTHDGKTWELVTETSTGSWKWNVPLTPSDSCLVRITDIDDPMVQDQSDSFFTIRGIILLSPDTGEILTGGTEYQITWSSAGTEEIKIYYSVDNGTNYIYIDTVDASLYTYTWTVPIVRSNQCKVRIDGGTTMSSANYPAFTILPSIPNIVLNFPIVGEVFNPETNIDITWSTYEVTEVTLEFSKDGGLHWETIASNIDASLESYRWSVPDIESIECIIRISSSSNPEIVDECKDTFYVLPTKKDKGDQSSTIPAIVGGSYDLDDVTIYWKVSDDSYIAGYNVYRSIISGYGYHVLNDSPILEKYYTDKTMEKFLPYYYVITSVDENGQESDFSEEITATIPQNWVVSVFTDNPPRVMDSVYDLREWFLSYSITMKDIIDVRLKIMNDDQYMYFCVIPERPLLTGYTREEHIYLYFDSNYDGRIDASDDGPPYEGIIVQISPRSVKSLYKTSRESSSFKETTVTIPYSLHTVGTTTVYEIAVPFDMVEGADIAERGDTFYFGARGPRSYDYLSGSEIYERGFGTLQAPFYFRASHIVSYSFDRKLPETFFVGFPYPNPFNPSTTIEFVLPSSGLTSLVIYNITGQKVRELIYDTISVGKHSVIWNGKDNNGASVSSGVYIAHLTMGKHTASRLLTFVK